MGGQVMKNVIFDNLGLKILALIVALIVWLLVVNVNDPVITRTINGVSVTVTNANYVESQGLSSKLGDSSETISVTVTGHRSAVESLTKDDVTAEADLTQIISLESNPTMVPLSVSAPGITVNNIVPNPRNVEVALEPMKSDNFIVIASSGDTKPKATDVEVGTLTPSIETVTIVGPESLMNIIDRVVALVDVSNLRNDRTLNAELKVFDKNGSEFSDASLNNLKFLNSDKDITVDVDLWSVVTGIGLEVEPQGDVAEGYSIADISTTPEVISVAGTEEALAALAEAGNKITIDGSEVNINGFTEDFNGRIDISGYLPEGVKLSENVSSTVLVTVTVEPLGTVNFEIPSTDIIQENLGAGLGVIYNKESIKVSVQGASEELGKITEKSLKATIDYSGMGAGNYENVNVGITLPPNCYLVSIDTVNLEIFSNDSVNAGTDDQEAAS